METKTVYRVAIKVRKDYWTHSPQYDTFEELMATLGPWLAKQHNCFTRFYTEQVMVQG